MPNSIETIKNRVSEYKDLITKREELQKKYNSWQEYYQDVKKELALVKAIYDAEKTPEAEKKLNEWLQEEKDYLEEINAAYEKLEKVNSELGIYNEKLMEEQTEYVANVIKFKEISDRMNELEKKGLKLYSRAEIGTNVIDLENAEGRKKHIHQYDAEEYINLVNEKRRLAKLNHKLENKFINCVKEEEIVETQDITIIPPKKPSIKYDDQLYQDLSVEERIKIIEEKMELMRNASGRKELITCFNEKIYISREYVGNYKYCASLLNKYKNQLSINAVPPTFNNNGNDLSQNLINAYRAGTTNEDYYLGEDFDFMKKEDENKELTEEEFNRQNDELFKMLENHQREVSERNVKENNEKAPFIKITKVIKPKNKEKLKDKIKRAAVVIAASLVLVTTLTVSSILMNLQPNKSNNIKKDDLSSSQQLSEEEIKDVVGDIKGDVDFEIEEDTINDDKDDSSLKLGDQITISDTASIYSNMYDATLKRDGQSRYFKDQINRNVGGIVVNSNGELKTYYFNNPESEENLNDALALGGEITAILSVNENGYEGFYNVDDVKNLSKDLGGMKR